MTTETIWRDLRPEEKPQKGDRFWEDLSQEWKIAGHDEPMGWKFLRRWQRPVIPMPCRACAGMREALLQDAAKCYEWIGNKLADIKTNCTCSGETGELETSYKQIVDKCWAALGKE